MGFDAGDVDGWGFEVGGVHRWHVDGGGFDGWGFDAGDVDGWGFEVGGVHRWHVDGGGFDGWGFDAGDVDGWGFEVGGVHRWHVDGGGFDGWGFDAGDVDGWRFDAGDVDGGGFDGWGFDAGDVDAREINAGQINVGHVNIRHVDGRRLDVGGVDGGNFSGWQASIDIGDVDLRGKCFRRRGLDAHGVGGWWSQVAAGFAHALGHRERTGGRRRCGDVRNGRRRLGGCLATQAALEFVGELPEKGSDFVAIEAAPDDVELVLADRIGLEVRRKGRCGSGFLAEHFDGERDTPEIGRNVRLLIAAQPGVELFGFRAKQVGVEQHKKYLRRGVTKRVTVTQT